MSCQTLPISIKKTYVVQSPVCHVTKPSANHITLGFVPFMLLSTLRFVSFKSVHIICIAVWNENCLVIAYEKVHSHDAIPHLSLSKQHINI